MEKKWTESYREATGFYDATIKAYKEKKYDNTLMTNIITVAIEKYLQSYLEYKSVDIKSTDLSSLIAASNNLGAALTTDGEFLLGIRKIESTNGGYEPDDDDILEMLESLSQSKIFVNINLKNVQKTHFTSV